MAEQRPWVSCLYHFLSKFYGTDVEGPRWMLLSFYIKTEESQALVRCPFIMGCKQTCSLSSRETLFYWEVRKSALCQDRDTSSIFQGYLLYIPLWKDNPEQKDSSLLTKCVEKWETPRGNFLPTLLLSENIVSSPLLAIPYSSRGNSLFPPLWPTNLCIYCKYIMCNMCKGGLYLFLLLYCEILESKYCSLSIFYALTPAPYIPSPRKVFKIIGAQYM